MIPVVVLAPIRNRLIIRGRNHRLLNFTLKRLLKLGLEPVNQAVPRRVSLDMDAIQSCFDRAW
jgi:hypothetical protein